MKQYLKRFWVWYALIVILAVVYMVLSAGKQSANEKYVRTNTECLTEERVFDYADKLTDAEEDALRELIAERENQIGCDIVLVVLEEPIGDSSSDLMRYADDFYDENKFGYNRPWGDGVIYVDNWYSYGDYNGDVWMSTSGRVEARYSSSTIDSVIRYACDVVNEDPYKGYERYVNRIYQDMSSDMGLSMYKIRTEVILIIALIVTAIYLFVGLYSNKGTRTTTAMTYVENGQPMLNNAQDIFVTKRVTSRRISSNSGGGGGGHHISGGGHSHGGGGGHH